MFVGSFIIVPNSTEQESQSPYSSQEIQDIRPKEMILQKSYWKFFLWAILMSSTGLLIIGHAATYAADLGASLRIAGLAAGFISIFNGISRPLFGHYYDNQGQVKAMAAVGCIFILAIIGLFASYFLKSLVVLFISYGILGIAYGGGPIIISSYTKVCFGGRHYGTNLGITNLNIVAASFVGPWLAGVLRKRWNSYLPAFILMLVLVLASIALIPWKEKRGA